MKYYTLDRILKEDAIYNMIIGERSNGKTYSVLNYGIKRAIESFIKGEYKNRLAIIRRWQDDFKGKRSHEMFSSIVSNGLIEKYSKGKYDTVEYFSGRWFFAKKDETGSTRCDEPFAYAFSLSAMEHDKSTSYPDVDTILFDEFLTRSYYLPNEFVTFMNVLSTIIRERDNVKIFMLGNTVNKFCPYFDEMGLHHIKEMKRGEIEVYEYGESGLKVAVEYAEKTVTGKKSDKYFAFDNPKLHMITGGDWEIDIYPHLPEKYKPKDILFTYFIEFGNELLQCEIIEHDKGNYTYIHRKTTPIKDEDNDLLFTTRATNNRYFQRRNIANVYDDLGKKIYSYFRREKVFYQSNDVGEIVRNYLVWCKKSI